MRNRSRKGSSSSTTRIFEGFLVSMVGILARLERGTRLRHLSSNSQLQNLPGLWHGVKRARLHSFTVCASSVDTSLDQNFRARFLPESPYAFEVAGCCVTKGKR